MSERHIDFAFYLCLALALLGFAFVIAAGFHVLPRAFQWIGLTLALTSWTIPASIIAWRAWLRLS